MTATFAPTPARGGVAARALDDVVALHPLVWCYLFSVVIPVGFNVGSIALTALRLLLLIVVVPLTVRLFMGRYGKVYLVDYLFYLHMVWATVAVGVNNPARVVENSGSTAIEFLGGYVIGRAFIRSRADMIGLIKALCLLVFISLPLAIPETLYDTALIPALIDKIPGLTTVAQVTIEKRMGLNRVMVFFSHPIHYGLFCSTVLALTFIGLRGVKSLGARWFVCIAAGIGVFLSLSSGALLAALLQVGLILWAFVFRENKNRWWLLVGLFAAMYVTVDLLSNRTPIKVLMSYATFSAHTAYYRSIIFEWGMINVWANPVFGLGLNSWVRPSYMRTGTMDNFWLVMAVRYGIPGFLLIAAGYADALFRIGRQKLMPDTITSNLRLGWMLMFSCLSFTLCTVHLWTNIYSFVFFLLGAGLWIASAPYDDSGGAATAGTAQPAAGARQTLRSRGVGMVYARNEEARGISQAALTRQAAPSPAEPPPADPPAASAAAENAPHRPAPVYTRFSDGRRACDNSRYPRRD